MFHSRKQEGFLVPLSIILIVGLAVLAVTIAKLNSQAGTSSIREGISAQALYAAESGAQLALNQLFFPTASRANADAACVAVNGQNVVFTATGLQNCNTDLSCSRSIDAADNTSFYTVGSDASCGAGEIVSERIIQVSAYINE